MLDFCHAAASKKSRCKFRSEWKGNEKEEEEEEKEDV